MTDFLQPEIQDTLDAATFAAGVRNRQELVEQASARIGELRAIIGTDDTVYESGAADIYLLLPTKAQRDMLRTAIAEVRVSRGRDHVGERVNIITR